MTGSLIHLESRVSSPIVIVVAASSAETKKGPLPFCGLSKSLLTKKWSCPPALLVMELGIAESTEMKACLRDVIEAICLAAVCNLAVLIDHERAQSQHSFIQRIPQKQFTRIVLLR